jgi:hypothetical protein
MKYIMIWIAYECLRKWIIWGWYYLIKKGSEL